MTDPRRVRRVKCRKCRGKGGRVKVGLWDATSWQACPECLGKSKTKQVVG